MCSAAVASSFQYLISFFNKVYAQTGILRNREIPGNVEKISCLMELHIMFYCLWHLFLIGIYFLTNYSVLEIPVYSDRRTDKRKPGKKKLNKKKPDKKKPDKKFY